MPAKNDKWTLQAQTFDRENPHVKVELVKLIVQLKGRGHVVYSIRGLFEVLRFRRAMETADRFSEWKLNNNYCSYYARQIMKEYPEHEGFFRLRDGEGEIEPELFPEQTFSNYAQAKGV